MKLVRAGLVAAIAVAFALPALRSDAQAAPADPADTVLAIVSPIVAPACATSGTATLLVPIVSGLVSASLPSDVPSVGDVLLDTIGPVFVVCGELPAPPGTRCQVDDQIAGVVPIEVSSLTGPTPAVLGNLLDSLDALLAALQLPPTAALQEALVCTIHAGPGVTDAPAGEAPAALPPTAADPGLGSTGSPVVGSLPSAPTATTPTPVPVRTVPERLIATVDRLVPGGIKALQILTVSLFALTLLSGWAGSWRDERRHARGTP